MNAAELRDWLRLSADFDPLRVELLDALDELEHSRDELLVRAWRALAIDEPANRHPACVLRHRRAVELSSEIRELVAAGVIRS